MKRLVTVTFFVHMAEQLLTAVLPLIAVLFFAAAGQWSGILLASQGAAWLLIALPAGVWVDRFPRNRLLVLAAAASALMLVMAALQIGSPHILGILAFLTASGSVVAVLSGFAALPMLVARQDLPTANARLELARAVATLLAPALAGGLAGAGQASGALLAAAAAAALAAAIAGRLPPLPAPAQTRPPHLWKAIREGAAFVATQALLRSIALAAIAWNMAFFALAAIAVPLCIGPLGLSPPAAGMALSAQGAGLVLGALLAAPMAARLSPSRMLLAGPALSVLAMLGWATAIAVPEAAIRLALIGLAQFLIGFGPMLWQVVQTSLRQIVAPPAMLGRVGACMQVAVFGVRPLGALFGGVLAGQFGAPAALGFVLLGFAASLAVVAASPLRRLVRMPEAALT